MGDIKESIEELKYYRDNFFKILENLLSMDKDLRDQGQGLDYRDMPIDVLACNPPKESPFGFSTYPFSSFNQKILAIEIEIEQIDMVKEKLASMFGKCILEGYCENKDSILILRQNRRWSLHVYFFENLKPHHKKIKNLKTVRDKKQDEQLKEAF